MSTWFDRLLASITERGRAWIRIPSNLPPLDQLYELAANLVSETGEASGAALAGEVLTRYRGLDDPGRLAFLDYLATGFAPDADRLRAVAERYLAAPSPDLASDLWQAAEPPRQELLRRLNMGQNGTATLVAMREQVLGLLKAHPSLRPLDRDLHHLLGSWFNRGFLEMRRIDWHTSAAILEKIIAYEAVHEVHGWDDLRRRLAPDRRCFAFFHPALPDEPLIFVEVALVKGLAGAIEPLLSPDEAGPAAPDTAIFYSISNCQRGLRGVSFGNFLIKQVVEDLKAELPGLTRFSTLSPVPGFRSWLERSGEEGKLRPEDQAALVDAFGTADPVALAERLAGDTGWIEDPARRRPLETPLKRLCAQYLTQTNDGRGPSDPVARFHLRNGARLERINFLANHGARGMTESFGLMVNYLYDLDRIEANHEGFVRQGEVAHSADVGSLLRDEGQGLSVGTLLSFAGGRR